MLVRLDTRQEQAQLAAAEAQRDLARLNLERMRGLRDEGRSSPQAEYDRGERRAQAGGGAGRRDPRHDRAQDDPRAVRGHPRHPPGQPRPVPRRAATRSCRCSRCDPIYVNFSRAAAGGRPAARWAARCASRPRASTGADVAGKITAINSGRRRGDAQRPGAGDASPTPSGRLRPGMFVEAQVHAGRRAQTVVAAAGLRDQLRARTATRSSSSTTSRGRTGRRYRACASSS